LIDQQCGLKTFREPGSSVAFSGFLLCSGACHQHSSMPFCVSIVCLTGLPEHWMLGFFWKEDKIRKIWYIHHETDLFIHHFSLRKEILLKEILLFEKCLSIGLETSVFALVCSLVYLLLAKIFFCLIQSPEKKEEVKSNFDFAVFVGNWFLRRLIIFIVVLWLCRYFFIR
jgi:hypothetical protein